MDQSSCVYINMKSRRPGSPTKVSKPSLRSDLVTPTMSSDDRGHNLFQTTSPVTSPGRRRSSKPRTPRHFNSPRHEKSGPVRDDYRTPDPVSPPKANVFNFSFMGEEEESERKVHHGYEEEHARPLQPSGNDEYSGFLEERNPPSCSREHRETNDDAREIEELTSSSRETGANALKQLVGEDLYNLLTPKKSNGENSGVDLVPGFDCIKGDIHGIQSSCSLMNEKNEIQNPCMVDEMPHSSMKKLVSFVKTSTKGKPESVGTFPLASQESRYACNAEGWIQNPFLSKDLTNKETKMKTTKSRQRKWLKAIVHSVRRGKKDNRNTDVTTDNVGTTFPFLKDNVSKLSSEPGFSESLDSSSGIVESLSKQKDDESVSSVELLVKWLQCAEIEGVDPICSKENPRSMVCITSSGSKDLFEAYTNSEELEHQDTKLKQLDSPRDHHSISDTDDFVGKVLQLPANNLNDRIERREPVFRKFDEDTTLQRSEQFTRASSLDAQLRRQRDGASMLLHRSSTKIHLKKPAALGRRRSRVTLFGFSRP